MRKPIEMGIFTDGWVVNSKRVGPDAFVALVSHERRGTSPVVVVRNKAEDLVQLPTDFHCRLGHWTRLSEGTYGLAEKSPVVVYGGEGPCSLTSHRMLTGTEDVRDIDDAFRRMMSRAARFARAIMEAA